ncbi:serine hydrolase domain-containing protein [Flavitalea flava]
MHSNRRQFIKKAGAGFAGLGLSPAFAGLGNFWTPDDLSSFPGGDLPRFPRATPESQGVSSRSIREFIAAANASDISWHSFMLLRHGQVIAEGWWQPFESQFVHTLYSLSKSFTSTAIGLLVKEGKLDIHAKVISFFPQDLPAIINDNLREMTVRSLLTMNTGHGEDTLPKMRASQETWIRTFLAQPVPFAPGTHFLYNTGNTYMLGAILHQITGETLEAYLAPRLFKPLGITGYDWETSPQGLNTAGYGLRVKTEDIAALGQLYLQKGKWKDMAILPEEWVKEATRAQTTSQVNNGDWSEGYGYQFWRCTHGFYRGDGAFGQYCIVMPELDAVLAVTSQSSDMQHSLNIIWDHLPTGMKPGVLPENNDDQTGLKKDLAALTLPVAKGSVVSPVSSGYDAKKWSLSANDFGLDTLQFSFSDKGCTVVGGAAGKSKTLTFGWENWIVTPQRDPYLFTPGMAAVMPSRIAGTATWINDHTLQLNTRMVESIFGDRVTCVFSDDRLTVSFLDSGAQAAKKTADSRKMLEGRISG